MRNGEWRLIFPPSSPKLPGPKMKLMQTRLGRIQGGYTLLEIMLVLAIIACLLGAGTYLMVGNLDSAREQRVQMDIISITTQLRSYENDALILPTTEQGLQALVTQPATEPVPRKWRQSMKELALDPWGKVYMYRYPGKHNPKGFDLYSLGPDRVESEDDIGNWKK